MYVIMSRFFGVLPIVGIFRDRVRAHAAGRSIGGETFIHEGPLESDVPDDCKTVWMVSSQPGNTKFIHKDKAAAQKWIDDELRKMAFSPDQDTEMDPYYMEEVPLDELFDLELMKDYKSTMLGLDMTPLTITPAGNIPVPLNKL
jgi:hypothetical protein